MKTKIPSLGKLIAEHALVAKTRRVHSSYAMVLCKDGNMLVHVSLLAKAKHLNPKELTVDEYEIALHKIELEESEKDADV